MAVEKGPDEKVKLYASWNGATEVERAGSCLLARMLADWSQWDRFPGTALRRRSWCRPPIRTSLCGSETVLVRLGAQARRLPSARRSFVVGPGSWLGSEEAVTFSRSSAVLSRFSLERLRDRRKSIPERGPID
jgi:hypothetical protein